jgi:uroporphyrin-III C-methyltransferase/precorrin-2 dehydrogenase/sirohydrochlorin ferrochelatase
MNYLPIYIDLRDHACLVVGAGAVAQRKVELLLQAGARVVVVAPEISAGVRELANERAIELTPRAYASTDLDRKRLVIATTNRGDINARVAADAHARSIPVNVVDDPALCSFIMPAIVDRSPVLIAVSTGGASPVLARLTRARVEAALPHALGRLAGFAARHRAAVKQRIAEAGARRAFWEQVLDGEVGTLVLAERDAEADAAFAAQLAHGHARADARVMLIAGGDGDPDRLTLRAARALGSADVLMHERAALRSVQALGRRDAVRIDIGQLGEDGWSNAQLAQAAAEYAQRGERVCVIRAGDPYAGSAPAEETVALEAAGVRFEVVRPGL